MTEKINYELNHSEDQDHLLSILAKPMEEPAIVLKQHKLYFQKPAESLLVLLVLRRDGRSKILPRALHHAFLYSPSLNN
jgi:hypothetical protein